jgi:DNA replication initiation complex subunit (GINS family)
VQYTKLYQEVKDENLQLRTQNGDISQALNQEMRALQRDNCKLRQLLEKAESELRNLMEKPNHQVVKAADSDSGESDLAGLQPDENIFEVRIEEGELSVDSQVSTFLTLDFFDHATQVCASERGVQPLDTLGHLPASCLAWML